MFENRDKRIQIPFLESVLLECRSKSKKTHFSKIRPCTEDYFVLFYEPETCLQKKKYLNFSYIVSAGQRV